MCSFGICRTDDVQRGLRVHLKPLVFDGLSQPDDPNAMRVVAQGLPAGLWVGDSGDDAAESTSARGSDRVGAPCTSFEARAPHAPLVDRAATPEDPVVLAANLARVRAWFETNGTPPRAALEQLDAWLRAEVGPNRPVIIGSPVTFDFMWLYWYWWRLMNTMPVFGFSGLDLRSYFMGSHGVGFLGTGKQRYLRHYPNEHSHTHDPLDDARQQGQIWADMVRARESRPS